MRASLKRTFSILISGAFLIASLFVYTTFIKPAYEDIMTVRQQIASRNDILSKNKAAVAQVKSLIAQYQNQNISQVQNSVSYALPLSPSLPDAVAQITGLASANQLSGNTLASKQLAIKPSGSSLIKGVGAVRFDAKFSGSYESFKAFLQSLENNMRIMDVSDLRIEAGSLLVVDQFNYSLTINTYYQAQ